MMDRPVERELSDDEKTRPVSPFPHIDALVKGLRDGTVKHNKVKPKPFYEVD